MAELSIDNYSHGDPSLFYTETNIPGPGLDTALQDQVLCVRCKCGGICSLGCQCIRYSGGELNYVNSRLNESKVCSSSFVLECNDLCDCTLSCGNRLVQFGPIKDLCVFQTGAKGCGLKTESFIQRGSFICEYAGELIGKDEARCRARNDGVNYIFVLKEHYNNSVTETIVDPTCIGNIGRYINHSCQPNAAIIPVRVDSPIPKLSVFSVMDILAGQEITYDYSSGGAGLGSVQCFCGTKSCRGYLPLDKDLLV